jgi:hypothetical protein
MRNCGERRLAIWILIFGCLTFSFFLDSKLGPYAQSSGTSEYEVKAGFLYNFAKFIEWPSSAFGDANVPIRLCIFGRDPFGDAIDEVVRGKSVNGREFAIRRMSKLEDLRGCHLVFISTSEARHLSEVLEGLKGTASLTVGDGEGFAERGGAIEFFVEGNKVRFSVNVDAIKRAHLEVSSKLLALAKIVHDGDRGKGD